MKCKGKPANRFVKFVLLVTTPNQQEPLFVPHVKPVGTTLISLLPPKTTMNAKHVQSMSPPAKKGPLFARGAPSDGPTLPTPPHPAVNAQKVGKEYNAKSEWNVPPATQANIKKLQGNRFVCHAFLVNSNQTRAARFVRCVMLEDLRPMLDNISRAPTAAKECTKTNRALHRAKTALRVRTAQPPAPPMPRSVCLAQSASIPLQKEHRR